MATPNASERRQEFLVTGAFTLDDLEANRAGKISDQQRSRARARVRQTWIIVAIVAALSIWMIVLSLASPQDSSSGFLLIALMLVFTAALVALARAEARRARRMNVKKVLTFAYTEFQPGSRNSSPTATLIANGLRVKLDVRLQRIVRAEEPLCVYLDPSTATVLSIEPATAEEVGASTTRASDGSGDPFRASATIDAADRQVRDRVQAALMAGGQFTAEDLASNRGGRITPAQRRKLFMSALFLVIAATLCGAVAFGLFMVGSIAVVASFVFGLLALLFLFLATDEAHAGIASHSQWGEAEGNERTKANVVDFKLAERLTVSVPMPSFDVAGFHRSDVVRATYRVYYAGHGSFLSIEPIDVQPLVATAIGAQNAAAESAGAETETVSRARS